jgi:hypothetical protein
MGVRWGRVGGVAALVSSVLVGMDGQSGAIGGGTEITERFDYSGGAQTFTVPDGVFGLDAVACGGQGGDAFGTLAGGLGGRARASVGVSTGEVLAIVVGGAGAGAAGGFNGGGDGFPADPEVGGGGGASDVRHGGAGLEHRVVVGGGGGGGSDGGEGGDGGGANGQNGGQAVLGGGGGTQVAGGIGGPGDLWSGTAGSLGQGGEGGFGLGAAGGGGGLYGGGSGGVGFVGGSLPQGGGGGGGSGLGDTFEPGVCEGAGWVEITYVDPRPAVTPYGVLVSPEGDAGSSTWQLPVFLSEPLAEPVTIEYRTVDGQTEPGLASSGSDFVSTSGTVTFAPGETVQYVDIEFLGDTDVDQPLLWGEWGLVEFSNPSDNALLDTDTFFGHGLFIIIDDD